MKLLSYVYIRKDVSFITNSASRALLKAFATALFDPNYIDLCLVDGLIPVPQTIRVMSLKGLEMIDVSDVDGSTVEWTFEKSTEPGGGQGEFVISSRRETHKAYEINRLSGEVTTLTEDVNRLNQELEIMRQQLQLLQTTLAQASSAQSDATNATEGSAAAGQGNNDTVVTSPPTPTLQPTPMMIPVSG